MLIAGGVGYLIGSAKGRHGLGFVLGLFVDLIGWIIMAVIHRTPTRQAEHQDRVAAQRPDTAAAPKAAQQWAPDPTALMNTVSSTALPEPIRCLTAGRPLGTHQGLLPLAGTVGRPIRSAVSWVVAVTATRSSSGEGL